MNPSSGKGRFDAIVVGGGHNGLVAAAYLGRAGLRTLVLEGNPRLGGPAATLEFMPGYFTTIANSPGSLEPKIVEDLELERYGLRWVRPDPTLVQPLDGERIYVGWRDPKRNHAQLETYAPGEAARYDAFFAYLQAFADRLGISIFEPPPSLQHLVRNLTRLEDQEAFSRILFGNIRDLMDEFELAPQTQALIAPLAVVGGQVAPSTPGSPFNLMMRPLSLASLKSGSAGDPRLIPLRGSTGLPVGGMGAITDALSASLRAHGGEVMVGKPVATIRSSGGVVRGVVTKSGEEYTAPIVVSALSPVITVRSLVDDTSSWGDLQPKMKRKPMRGRAFKVVLALDGMPRYAGAKSDEEAALLTSAQFRIAPSLDYIEAAHTDMLQGRLSHQPVIWGLCPSMTSPTLAPPGKHVLSLNVGNAPYRLREGTWAEQRDVFAKRAIAKLAEYMPNLPGLISDYRIIDPTQFESEFGLVEANITHGDTLPFHMFWMRPMPGLHAYRTPTRGLYLSGNGTWPGNYISGISGHNASQAVLRDLREAQQGERQSEGRGR
ncbi:phytoene desaturase family protein [Reyranella soli]|uniref:Pyridine nucleotide-disulfide oxidoreductase domain-containing protein 2 n=1 Tax=Reyranella soli TaxID=1230389 RepID=A0A512NPI8_9HYPH|nr:NAD(P)/FAD-dependent oxidoreductase [Reyranella soli]GEP60856.1 FAD-dependent oxidoreductase [Reyranella soli]